MRFVAIAAAAIAAAAIALMPVAAAAEPMTPGGPKPCHADQSRRADARTALHPQKLGQLPPADLLSAVYRSVDRCPTPVVLRKDVGAPVRPDTLRN